MGEERDIHRDALRLATGVTGSEVSCHHPQPMGDMVKAPPNNNSENEMTTVSKEFADNVVAHQGFYNGDDDNTLGDNPRVVEITEYDNAFGGVGYGLTLDGKQNRYTESDYVRNPRQYWAYQGVAA